MEQPFVSIIVPVYNGQDTIRDCILSLLDLDYPIRKYEIIVVDNQSKDGTFRILQEHVPKIRVFREEVRGPAAARNTGIHQAQGGIQAFIDADCIADRNWLRQIVKPLENADAGLVGGKISAIPPARDIEIFGETIHDHDSTINNFRPPYVISMNSAARRDVLEKIGYFDTDMLRSEDVDLSYRIIQAGLSLVYQPEAVIFHENEKDLYGLFREGVGHGYYAVPLNRKHAKFLESYGYDRFSTSSCKQLFRTFCAMFKPDDRRRGMYQFFFDLGKRIGKLLGSVRFRYWDIG